CRARGGLAQARAARQRYPAAPRERAHHRLCSPFARLPARPASAARRCRAQLLRRAEMLRSRAQRCRAIDSWDSPAGHLLEDRVQSCAEAIEALAACADELAEAY